MILRETRHLVRKVRLLFASSSERRHTLVGHPGRWKMKRDFQIEFLKHVGLRPTHYLLDLGCGTLRGGIPIINYLQEEHYYGVEVREKVLQEGRKELREAELEDKKPVLVLTEELSSLHLERTFDLIWAFSVLIHLSDEILNEALNFVRKHLKKTGYLYANVNIGERKDSYWYQGFPLAWRSMAFYEEAALRNGLRASDMGTIEALGFKSGYKGHDQKHMLKFGRV